MLGRRYNDDVGDSDTENSNMRGTECSDSDEEFSRGAIDVIDEDNKGNDEDEDHVLAMHSTCPHNSASNTV